MQIICFNTRTQHEKLRVHLSEYFIICQEILRMEISNFAMWLLSILLGIE
jgi:hypothetical protein